MKDEQDVMEHDLRLLAPPLLTGAADEDDSNTSFDDEELIILYLEGRRRLDGRCALCFVRCFNPLLGN